MALALLSQLSNLSLSQPQGVVASLRRLKHELIGHDQKKDLFVRLGIVPPLVKILEGGPRMDEAWSDARVEAGIAVGSLAYGRDSFQHLASQLGCCLGCHVKSLGPPSTSMLNLHGW